jgi:hypothetical protein
MAQDRQEAEERQQALKAENAALQEVSSCV